MRKLKLALAQTNPTVGDISGNLNHIKDMIGQARSEQADVVVFPELALTGYPPEDLLLKPSFIDRNLRALEELVGFAPDLLVMVGFVDRRDDIYNSAAVLYGGKIQGYTTSNTFRTMAFSMKTGISRKAWSRPSSSFVQSDWESTSVKISGTRRDLSIPRRWSGMPNAS
jgi:predicted amidohydrolase